MKMDKFLKNYENKQIVQSLKEKLYTSSTFFFESDGQKVKLRMV